MALRIDGTSGDDVLVGTIEDDIIDGLGGNDRIQGMAGSDQVIGGLGDDDLRGGRSDESIGSADSDLVSGQEGSDLVVGSDGADDLGGLEGNDTIYDARESDAALDTINGHEGDDTITSANDPASRDVVGCGLGTDTVVADSLDEVDSATCEDVQNLLTEEQAQIQDAQQYAADFGVTVEEAKRRLELQDDVGDLRAALEANEAATFGDLELLHEPQFRVVTYFTQGGEQTIQPYVQGTPLQGMVENQQVSAPLTELEAAQVEAMNIYAAQGVAVESDINVTENRVEVYVPEEARTQQAQAVQTASTQLPAHVAEIPVEALSEPLAFYGGNHLSGPAGCTAGFVVRADDGSEGMVTAGHCCLQSLQ